MEWVEVSCASGKKVMFYLYKTFIEIWTIMINKDESITIILHHLQKKFGRSEILIKDHWDADLCAIGLTNKTGEYLIYISTFGKNETQYYASIEEVFLGKNIPPLGSGSV